MSHHYTGSLYVHCCKSTTLVRMTVSVVRQKRVSAQLDQCSTWWQCAVLFAACSCAFFFCSMSSVICVSLYHFTAKIRLKSKQKFKISSWLAENTLYFQKINRLMMLRVKMAVDCDNQKKHKHALGRWQNVWTFGQSKWRCLLLCFRNNTEKQKATRKALTAGHDIWLLRETNGGQCGC